jgi:Txe/YoeB family toxin of Txe-Axe toxin-antitoxin module
MLKRIIGLCLETCKNPRQGVGKPEALKNITTKVIGHAA